MSKCDIQPQYECRNKIFNGKMRYSARFRKSNRISNVKRDIRPELNDKIGLCMS